MITTPIYGFNAPDDGEPFNQGAASMRDQVRQVEAALALATPTGLIVPFAGGTLPVSGWLLCDGLPHDKTAHRALWDVIQYTYGGDGADIFNVPDLQDKSIVGASGTRPLGSTGGTPAATMPEHQHGAGTHHSMTVQGAPAGQGKGGDWVMLGGGSGGAWATGGTIPAPGGDNYSPYVALNYIIKT